MIRKIVNLNDTNKSLLIVSQGIMSLGRNQTQIVINSNIIYNYTNIELLNSDFNKIKIELTDSRNWMVDKPNTESK